MKMFAYRLFSFLRRVIQSRWALFRLVVALALLSALVVDNPARLVRLEFASLPEYDYVSEVRQLREEGRYGEALVVAEAGSEALQGDQLRLLLRERTRVLNERDSLVRKAKDLGVGAIRGDGNTTEQLIGAVAADFFLFGDIRDLVLESSQWLKGAETDKVLIGLSAVGVLTTVVPQVDWTAGLLKVARKSGALTKQFADTIVRACRRAVDHNNYGELKVLTNNVAAVSNHSSPGGTIRLLRHIDDSADLARTSEFVSHYSDGAFALHVAGKDGIDLLKTGSKQGEQLLLTAAKKGKPGVELLRKTGLKPHPLVGLAKGAWKGTGYESLRRFAADYLDRYTGILIVPFLLLWTALESRGLAKRFRSLPAK